MKYQLELSELSFNTVYTTLKIALGRERGDKHPDAMTMELLEKAIAEIREFKLIREK